MKVACVDSYFWKDKKVFLTGHTGFKGGWLTLWLASMGAKVTGYSLAPQTVPNFYDVSQINSLIEKSHIANVCDLASLRLAMLEAKPDVVIHMAAQPLVRYSYINPVETYSTNVMGTVNILEATRNLDSVRATVIVTTDKCYENKEWIWGYRENESMGGDDPYSSSKGCAELVASAYRKSYFTDGYSSNVVATARAGNVIGGGDWSEDRLIPDAIKAFEASKPLIVRNPSSIRPWQHVLEPLAGYLILAQVLFEKGSVFGAAWNFGPSEDDNYSVQEIVGQLITQWGGIATVKQCESEQKHEAHFLRLDSSKARDQLGWVSKWSVQTAITKVVQWQKAFQLKQSMQEVSLMQIRDYQAH